MIIWCCKKGQFGAFQKAILFTFYQALKESHFFAQKYRTEFSRNDVTENGQFLKKIKFNKETLFQIFYSMIEYKIIAKKLKYYIK